jgi:hypothetical protein
LQLSQTTTAAQSAQRLSERIRAAAGTVSLYYLLCKADRTSLREFYLIV